MVVATILAAILISQGHLTRSEARFCAMIIVFDLLCVFTAWISVLNVVLLGFGGYLLSQKSFWRGLRIKNAPMCIALCWCLRFWT